MTHHLPFLPSLMLAPTHLFLTHHADEGSDSLFPTVWSSLHVAAALRKHRVFCFLDTDPQNSHQYSLGQCTLQAKVYINPKGIQWEHFFLMVNNKVSEY
jgi:hypothetical protein